MHMDKAFKVGDRVHCTDKDSQFAGKDGIVKSASATDDHPPAGHSGRIWNVQLEGVSGETKFDEAHIGLA